MKDKLVTLIGGGGFLGRYVAQDLLAAGARVRIAQRDPRQAYFLKPLGGLGQTQFAAADVTQARHGRARGRRVGCGGQSGRHLRAATSSASSRTARATVAEAAAAARRRRARPCLGDRRRSRIGVALWPIQGRRARRRCARRFPTATILRPSVVFGPRGPVHQPLRRDDRRAAGRARCCARGAVPAGLCRRRRDGGRRARSRSGALMPARPMNSAGPT